MRVPTLKNGRRAAYFLWPKFLDCQWQFLCTEYLELQVAVVSAFSPLRGDWNTSDKWSAATETVNPPPFLSASSKCWTFSAFTSSITKLLVSNLRRVAGGGWWEGSGLRDTTTTFAAGINHQANKLKAKWLLALNIYHGGKPNEVLYTPEDRGMLLFITVICGWLPGPLASEIREDPVWNSRVIFLL